MKYEINKEMLRKIKEKGHCLCDITRKCPCDDFLERDECICGAFKKI